MRDKAYINVNEQSMLTDIFWRRPMTTMQNAFDAQARDLTLADMISAGAYKIVLFIERLLARRA